MVTVDVTPSFGAFHTPVVTGLSLATTASTGFTVVIPGGATAVQATLGCTLGTATTGHVVLYLVDDANTAGTIVGSGNTTTGGLTVSCPAASGFIFQHVKVFVSGQGTGTLTAGKVELYWK